MQYLAKCSIDEFIVKLNIKSLWILDMGILRLEAP